MKEAFITWRPSTSSRAILAKVDEIFSEYQKIGLILTLRQLYYQLVSRAVIPNKVAMYNKLGNIISQARLSGIVDWSMIEDRTRRPSSNSHWNSPSEILGAAARSYYMDKWVGAQYHLEVWCEKDAVSNIIQPVCQSKDVTFMANRGYSSQSAVYDGYQRMADAHGDDKEIIVLYLGDHDPSGIDMTRDVTDRLTLFLGESFGCTPTVVRLALNLDQIDHYHPPENPAKTTDSRYESYRRMYGESSWELDALDPTVLGEIVEKGIDEYLDSALFEENLFHEKKGKEQILKAIKNL